MISGSHPHDDPEFQSLLSGLWSNPYLRARFGVIAIWITGMLLIRIWLVHRNRGVGQKLGWSLVVFFPIIGWLLYLGLAKIPKSHNDNPPVNPGDYGF